MLSSVAPTGVNETSLYMLNKFIPMLTLFFINKIKQMEEVCESGRRCLMGSERRWEDPPVVYELTVSYCCKYL